MKENRGDKMNLGKSLCDPDHISIRKDLNRMKKAIHWVDSLTQGIYLALIHFRVLFSLSFHYTTDKTQSKPAHLHLDWEL